MTKPRSRLRQGWLAFALHAVLLCSVAFPHASAHAEELATSPEDGDRLAVTPGEVSVLLSERVDPGTARLEVRDAAGQRWDNDDLVVEDTMHPHIRVTMRTDAPDAGYLVRWSAVSEVDGHPTSGSFGFAVGEHDPLQAAGDAAGVPLGAVVGRALVYAGLALAYAAAAFFGVMRSTPFDMSLARAWLHQGARVYGAGILVFAVALWRSTGSPVAEFAASSIGGQLVVRLGLALAALILLSRPVVTALQEKARWGAVAVLLGAGLMTSRLGHMAAFGPTRIGVDFLHLVLTLTWVGGLALLLNHLVASRPSPEETRSVGLRFGTLALTCLAGAGITGLVSSLAVIEFGTLPAVAADSAYGRFLAGKIVLTIAMVGVAAVGRFAYLSPRGPALRLRTTVAWELGIGSVVIVLAAFLTSLPPPN